MKVIFFNAKLEKFEDLLNLPFLQSV